LGCAEVVQGRGKGSGIPLGVQTVTHVRQFVAPKLQITLETGQVTKVSSNHPFLVMRRSRKDLGWQWMVASDVQPGDAVKAIPTWEAARSYDAGRLSAFLDGEGHLVRSNPQGGLTLGISQAEGLLADEILGLWRTLGFAASVKRFRRERRPHEKPLTVSGLAQLPEVLRALGVLRPSRLLRRFQELSDRIGTLRTFPMARVVAVEPLSDGLVVGLTTGPDHTLIADGIVGHNTSHRTRPLLIDSMHQALAEQPAEILLRDPDTIMEMLEFQYLDRTHAAGLHHDDRAMAMMIAYRVHLEMPMAATGMPPRVRWEAPEARQPKTEGEPLRNWQAQAWDDVDGDMKSVQQPRTGFLDYNLDDPDNQPDDFAMPEPDIPW